MRRSAIPLLALTVAAIQAGVADARPPWHQSAPGTIGTLAGGGAADGGPATAANIAQPTGLAIGPDRALYLAETEMNRIRRIDLETGVVTTHAGTGERGLSGDGGSARLATFAAPTGLAFDGQGNLFVADLQNDRIRRISPDGRISTVAGGGTCFPDPTARFCGDGGQATQARLNRPYTVAADGAANLFVADSGNNRVRRVAPDGTITTIAGTGQTGFAGDNGPGTTARVSSPEGLVLDAAGNLYISDTLTGRVRKLTPSGHITTVAGNGDSGFGGDGGVATAAKLTFPEQLTLDAVGRLLIVDHGNHRIRRVDLVSGIITTIAGGGGGGFGGDGGPATSADAKLASPYGVAAGPPREEAIEGDVFIGDTFNHRVRRVDGETWTLSTLGGNGSCCSSGDGGPAANAGLNAPAAVDVGGDGALYITDWQDHRVRRVEDGEITLVAGTGSQGFSGDGGPAADAALNVPQGLAVDRSGNVYIADTGNQRVRRVDAVTGLITTVAGTGSAGFSGDGGPATAAALSGPYGLTLDAGGNLFIADSGNARVRRVDAASGTITTVAGNGILAYTGDFVPATRAGMYPVDVDVDAAGNVFIADWLNGRIRKLESATGLGLIVTVAGSGAKGYAGDGFPAVAAALNLPRSVDVDAAGNLFIADFANMRVRRVSASGEISTLAGDGYFREAVAGNELPPIPTTCNLGGTCTGRYAGDGGPATGASLNLPTGMAVDASGRVYIADTNNRRVRVVEPS